MLTYLDHAATTPMRPVAVEAMLPFFSERFANPSGSHRFARDARKAIDEARDQVAELAGVRPGEIVFTGCGTEADNAVVMGVSRRRGLPGASSTMPCCIPSSIAGARWSASIKPDTSTSTRWPAALTPDVALVQRDDRQQ